MASGSQTCSGNWADLPIAPPNSRSAAAVTSAEEIPGPAIVSPISAMFVVVNPVAKISAKIPNMNGTSPTRVVMNALIAALEFSCSSYQCPISR